LSAKIFASISLALRAVTEAQVDLDVQSSATYSCGSPAIRPTLVVMPRVRSFQTSIASTISAMARMALRPLSGLLPAVRRPSAGADDESTDAFARGHDLAAVARRLGDEDVNDPRRLRSMTPRSCQALSQIFVPA